MSSQTAFTLIECMMGVSLTLAVLVVVVQGFALSFQQLNLAEQLTHLGVRARTATQLLYHSALRQDDLCQAKAPRQLRGKPLDALLMSPVVIVHHATTRYDDARLFFALKQRTVSDSLIMNKAVGPPLNATVNRKSSHRLQLPVGHALTEGAHIIVCTAAHFQLARIQRINADASVVLDVPLALTGGGSVTARRYQSQLWFVAPAARTDRHGVPIHALFRRYLAPTLRTEPIELVDYVEHLRAEPMSAPGRVAVDVVLRSDSALPMGRRWHPLLAHHQRYPVPYLVSVWRVVIRGG